MVVLPLDGPVEDEVVEQEVLDQAEEGHQGQQNPGELEEQEQRLEIFNGHWNKLVQLDPKYVDAHIPKMLPYDSGSSTSTS